MNGASVGSGTSFGTLALSRAASGDLFALLAGDQLSGDAPRRWLLVGREASLPDDQDTAGRWSVDHLFLEQLHELFARQCERAILSFGRDPGL